MPTSSDMNVFREIYKKSRNIVILTGAGVSAESGVSTFRGPGGFWRTYQAQNLATMEAFQKNSSLVWEFYHYRREVMISKKPNSAHIAIAECEKRLEKEGKRVTVITQNIDELHRKAGTINLIELHGSLFKTKCLECGNVEPNFDSPICPALKDKGAPEPNAEEARIPVELLLHCTRSNCKGLLRPAVVWFGESLNEDDLVKADNELENCDLCLVVGTSSVVYPAAMFAPKVASRGIPVAEFNLESTPATSSFSFHFQGPSGTTIPEALASFEY